MRNKFKRGDFVSRIGEEFLGGPNMSRVYEVTRCAHNRVYLKGFPQLGGYDSDDYEIDGENSLIPPPVYKDDVVYPSEDLRRGYYERI